MNESPAVNRASIQHRRWLRLSRAGVRRAFQRSRGQLSIQRTFVVITLINSLVLGYLIVISSQSLLHGKEQGAYDYVSVALTLLLAVLALLSFLIINKRIVSPLAGLSRQISRIEGGDENELLKVSGDDELAKLVNGFNLVLSSMRTAYAELDSSNGQLREANRQIADSIRYAGILQRSILPDKQLKEVFGKDHFILWQPKDIVGGDYYLFHADAGRCLAGVADCAGHGVPGAMMTMMARAGVDRSIRDVGIGSPAAILTCTDAAMRSILLDDRLSKAIATSMDMGLVALDFETRSLRFSGARISLYWSDGEQFHSIAGETRALCERRRGSYTDHLLPLLPGFTYYLTTDGYLDQSGGEHGFSIGNDRFTALLVEHASKPLLEQREAFANALVEFRGSYPQRDDITMLSFRFD
jgi:phosphoserine phosphatase RsbU/P